MVTQPIARWVSFLIACGAAVAAWAQAIPAPEAWQALEANDPGRAAAIFRQALEQSLQSLNLSVALFTQDVETRVAGKKGR